MGAAATRRRAARARAERSRRRRDRHRARDGFVIDGGPDSLLVQKPAAVELCRELGIRRSTLPDPASAHRVRPEARRARPAAGSVVPGAADALAPFSSPRCFRPGAKLRMATELLRPRRSAGDESIGSFMRRRFGDEAVIISPSRCWPASTPATSSSCRSMPFSPGWSRWSSSTAASSAGYGAAGATHRSPGGAFVSLPDGIAELPDTLVRALDDSTFRFHTAVAQVSGAGPYKLTLDTDAAVHTRAVIIATPAWAAARMLRSLDPPLGCCDDIPYASTATIALGFRREQVNHPLAGTRFCRPEARTPGADGRHVGLVEMAASRARRSCAGARFRRGRHRSAHQQPRRRRPHHAVLAELRPCCRSTANPCSHASSAGRAARRNTSSATSRRISAIDQRLNTLPGMFVTGSGYRGTGIPDCIADARATAAKAAVTI